MSEFVLDREIKGNSVGACLSAVDDLYNHVAFPDTGPEPASVWYNTPAQKKAIFDRELAPSIYLNGIGKD